ncbi:MAG TPA: ribosome small subunit-dependent GTPase A [Woeseiaceae bacterium]|nr:ribosome small subunit-dependent GTPase A [Woeseiaceae bacterium]
MPDTNATVTATYSRRMRLLLDTGQEVGARIHGKKLKTVCADRVRAEPIPGEPDWLITEIGVRRNVLDRPDSRGNTEVLAANIDRLVIVAAGLPKPDWFVLDRYLCAAELMPAGALIVFNKSDHELPAGAADALAVYTALGYELLNTSATTGHNLAELGAMLGSSTALVVGQSGVGKSSIINIISDGAELRTSAVSNKTREGKHTTVNSIMLPTAAGGSIIDSPGVRDYAPVFRSQSEVQAGFIEIQTAATGCRFANCLHLREPDCAVKSGVERGKIAARRYESYRRAVVLAERAQKKYR